MSNVVLIAMAAVMGVLSVVSDSAVARDIVERMFGAAGVDVV